jgi:transcriptional regulator with XRE-family HTH domain
VDRLLKITGDRIREMVRGRGYASIELFAHENRIPKSTLSELLNGKNDPKLSTLAKICSGLEVSLAELLRAPEIDLWVREVAPKYDARTRRARAVKAPKRPK